MAKNAAPEKARIAVFDFDGTVIDGQSGWLVSTYLNSKGLVSARLAARLLWWGTRYTLHLPHRQGEARELVFSALKGKRRDTIDLLLRAFHDEVLVPRYRDLAVAEIDRRKAEGLTVLIVSATFSVIAEVAAEKLGVDGYVATEMELDERGEYTGRVAGEVVEGAEKLRAVKRWADERFGEDGWEIACAYGDHHSDEELLSAAGQAFAVCPGATLKRCAKRAGWEILDWNSK